jgi:dipeptidase
VKIPRQKYPAFRFIRFGGYSHPQKFVMRTISLNSAPYFVALGSVLLTGDISEGCTNILVSKGASADGSTHIAYNADSGNLYGTLGHYPATKNNTADSKRRIWDWDGAFYLGEIPEVSETYNVVGNVNEHGLIIGETTFGGLPSLDGHGSTAIMDYGSLIWVTLQRAKSAREAIRTMDSLCQKYGYASDGESFSIADPNEVWLMELIGKGKEKGAVWVASKVPEGYVGSTANQARTQTWDWTDTNGTSVMWASDVVDFAVKQNLYPATSQKEDFSFSDIYDPATFGGVRLGEARVWNIFNKINDDMHSYLDYAQGYNLTNRMPLFVEAKQALSVNDTMNLMRTHFEGTWFDNEGVITDDVGAQSGNSPYRWRPLEWSSGGNGYVNERTVGVQQTAWAFVAQSRSTMPDPMKAVFWFAPDDSSTAVRIPLYGGATKIPPSFGDRVGQEPDAAVPYGVAGDAYNMNLESAFWVYNLVANIAYGERYKDVFPLIQAEISKYQSKFFAEVARVDKEAAELYQKNASAAVEMITKFGVDTGEQMTKDWLKFWMYLFATTRDGFTVTPSTGKLCDVHGPVKNLKGCFSRLDPTATTSGYTDAWYKRMITLPSNKEKYHVPKSIGDDEDAHKRKVALAEGKDVYNAYRQSMWKSK